MQLSMRAFQKPHKASLGHAAGGVQMGNLKLREAEVMASEEEPENSWVSVPSLAWKRRIWGCWLSLVGSWTRLLLLCCCSKMSSSEVVPYIARINHWGLNHNKISSSLSLQIWRGKKWGVETMDVFCWLPRFIMMITMMMSNWRNVAHIVNRWSPDAHQQNFSSQMFLALECCLPLPKCFIWYSCSPSPVWQLPAAEPVNPLPDPPGGGEAADVTCILFASYLRQVLEQVRALHSRLAALHQQHHACQAEAGREGHE